MKDVEALKQFKEPGYKPRYWHHNSLLALYLFSLASLHKLTAKSFQLKVRNFFTFWCVREINLTNKRRTWAVVVADNRGTRFESSNRQKIILNIVYCQLYWKVKNKGKKKEAGNGPFLNKQIKSSPKLSKTCLRASKTV